MRRRFHLLAQVVVGIAVIASVSFAYWRGPSIDAPSAPQGVEVPMVEITADEASKEQAVRVEPRAEVRVPVLVYHHIRDDKKHLPPGKRLYDITPAEFDAHLAYLQENGYQTITFAQLREAFVGGPLPEHPVILTFDDGRADQYAAWSALRERGFTGTWFVFTNAIGRPGYLTWEQLAEMRDAGAEIESHTVYHPFLTTSSDEELSFELTKSRDTLRSRLGIDSAVVAYPFGSVDDRVRVASAAAGYAMGRGLAQTNVQRSESPFDIGGWIATGDMRQFKGIFGDR